MMTLFQAATRVVESAGWGQPPHPGLMTIVPKSMIDDLAAILLVTGPTPPAPPSPRQSGPTPMQAALADPRLTFAPNPDPSSFLPVVYCNWRGEWDDRRIRPHSIHFGSTQFHPRPGWLMFAYDVRKDAWRDFSLENMTPVKEG